MAFLTGAIDKKNIRRFRRLVRSSPIAEFDEKPRREENWYVVNLRIPMDPETILEFLERYERKPTSVGRTGQRPKRGKMTPKELMEVANGGFPDGYLAEYYDQETGQPKEGHGDTLAKFIVWELAETFDPSASSWEQLSTAIGILERAQDDIAGVLQALHDKWDHVSN